MTERNEKIKLLEEFNKKLLKEIPIDTEDFVHELCKVFKKDEVDQYLQAPLSELGSDLYDIWIDSDKEEAELLEKYKDIQDSYVNQRLEAKQAENINHEDASSDQITDITNPSDLEECAMSIEYHDAEDILCDADMASQIINEEINVATDTEKFKQAIKFLLSRIAKHEVVKIAYLHENQKIRDLATQVLDYQDFWLKQTIEEGTVMKHRRIPDFDDKRLTRALMYCMNGNQQVLIEDLPDMDNLFLRFLIAGGRVKD